MGYQYRHGSQRAAVDIVLIPRIILAADSGSLVNLAELVLKRYSCESIAPVES